MTHAPGRAHVRPRAPVRSGERLPPGAVALDPLMRPAGTGQHQVGTEPLQQSPGRTPRGWVASSARRPQAVAPLGPSAGASTVSERPDGRAEVVFDRSALALPPDEDARRAEQPLDPCRSAPCGHPEHLQFPGARCYVLLERPGRHLRAPPRPDASPSGRSAVRTAGQVPGGRRHARRAPGRGDVEVLGQRLAPGGQGQAEAEQRAGARTPRTRPPAGRLAAAPAPTSGPRPAGW